MSSQIKNLKSQRAKENIKRLVILFFSLFLTLAVFSQISYGNANPKDSKKCDSFIENCKLKIENSANPSDWLYYKSNNDLSAYLGKKSSSLPTVRYQKNNDYLEFSMTEMSSNDIGSRLDNASVSLETNIQTPNTPTLFYRNIFDGIDANYQITNVPFRVKEEIVLKQKISNDKFLISNQIPNPNDQIRNWGIDSLTRNSDLEIRNSKDLIFFFSVETTGKPVKQKDGSIAFFGDNGDYLFQLDKPFMIDANLNRSEAATIEVISNDEVLISNKISSPNNQFLKQFKKFFPVWDLKNWNLFRNYDLEIRNSEPRQYQIVLTADSNWLNSPERVYPVVIDPTVTHNADANFTGQMNRIADNDSTSSTKLESSYPEAVKDPHTVLLLHFNEANGTTAGIRDYASTTRVITANGNASTTSYVAQLGIGNSLALDGAGDYLEIPDSADWDLIGSATEDFTIDLWVKHNNHTGNEVYVVQTEGDTNTNGWFFDHSDGSGLGFWAQTGDVTVIRVARGGEITDTNWHHVALVKNADKYRIYKDGVQVSYLQDNSTDTYADVLRIGRQRPVTDTSPLNGYLDSFRIIKGRALTPEEIKAAASRRPYAVYTSPVLDAAASVAWNTLNWTEGGVNTGNGEQPYNTGSLVAQWDFNDTSGTTLTASSSGSCTTSCNGTLTNFAYTASQDQATTTTGWTANNKRWGAGALMLESAAAADYVSISDPASNVLDPGTGDFSVEGWIKSSAVGQDTILQNNTTVGSCAANAGYILIVNGNRNLAAYASDGTTCYVNNLTANASSTEIADGRWHHFAFVADRDTKAYVYYDGRLATSTTINNTTAANPAATIYFGASGATGDSDFILDSARYYSRALSASEILSNYNVGNIEIQTRTGATSDPNDGTWEAWKPTTGETQLLSMDSDAANWRSDIMASTTIATSTETTLKIEGTGSLKIRTGMASTTAGTVALWHFEETGTTTGTYLYDETANNNDATTTGTTVVDGIFGKARKFNGNGDFLRTLDNTSLDFGTGDFTVDFWVRLNSIQQSGSTIISRNFMIGKGGYGDAGGWVITYGSNDGTTAVDKVNFFNSTTLLVSSNANALVAGQWYHISVKRSGTSITLFINGNQVASGTSSADFSNALNINIGQDSGNPASNRDLNGILDEPRILKGRALSADEIAETYRMGANHHLTRQVSAVDLSAQTKLAFWIAADRPGTGLEAMLGESDYANYELASSTLALSTTTVLYIKGDEIASSTSIKDSSFSGKAITVNGNARTAGGGKIGNSVYFDGTGDYLTVGDTSTFKFLHGAEDTSNFKWSLDFWYKANSFAGTGVPIDNAACGATASGICLEILTSRELDFYIFNGSATVTYISTPAGAYPNDTVNFHHIAYTYDQSLSSNNGKVYIDGVLVGAGTKTANVPSTGNAGYVLNIGRYDAGFYLNGYLDEFRIARDNVLTPDQIRQAYEYGLRTHPITIDFGATLQTSDLISNSTDYNFSLTATTSGLSATTSGLYLGDKIIIKENLGGTEYTAQGTVNTINTTTGAITVPSWDTGSTFPASNGYSPNATVFKWQREYFDLTGAATTTRNAITNLTLRPTNGAEGRTVWLDDFRYNTNYLTASSSSAITSSNNRYLQYRAIFSSWDSFVSPYLSAINTLYTALAQMFPPAIGVSGGGFLSF